MKKIILGFLLSISLTAVAWKTSDSFIKIGTNGDIIIFMGDTAQIKWDNGLAKLQFSNDGVVFSDIGSGEGGGGSTPAEALGVNILPNPGFETDLTGWSNTGGTLSRETTNPGIGSGNIKLVATGAGQYFESDLFSMPYGLQSDTGVDQCQMSFIYKAPNFNFVIDVIDDLSTVLINKNFSTTSWNEIEPFVFPCPASGRQIRIRATSSTAQTIELDNIYMGTLKTGEFWCAISNNGTASFGAPAACRGWVDTVTRVANGVVQLSFHDGFMFPPLCTCTSAVNPESSDYTCQKSNARNHSKDEIHFLTKLNGSQTDGEFWVNCKFYKQ